MKVVVAGSRHIESMAEVDYAIRHSGFTVTTLVSGYARGVDTVAIAWAQQRSVPTHVMPARWRESDGSVDRNAGFTRNKQMAEHADALIAVWDGESNGTRHMIDCMRKLGKPVHVSIVEDL